MSFNLAAHEICIYNFGVVYKFQHFSSEYNLLEILYIYIYLLIRLMVCMQPFLCVFHNFGSQIAFKSDLLLRTFLHIFRDSIVYVHLCIGALC